MMLRMLDLPEPLLPMRRTFCFLTFFRPAAVLPTIGTPAVVAPPAPASNSAMVLVTALLLPLEESMLTREEAEARVDGPGSPETTCSGELVYYGPQRVVAPPARMPLFENSPVVPIAELSPGASGARIAHGLGQSPSLEEEESSSSWRAWI